MATGNNRGGNCPLPTSGHDRILLAHGGGGRLMRQLIGDLFAVAFSNPELDQRHDGAVFEPSGGRLAVTTDSYVVHPLFFPGADIGKLAVYGTVNDLAMCGARPLYLSLAFIIEEGFSTEKLRRIVLSLRSAAAEVAVKIVTGDTKVVDHGKGHDIFINTTGVGVIEHDLTILPASVREGDLVILSGDIGRHGVAIMAAREGLSFETTIESDCAPLCETVARLIAGGVMIHCLRDLTRGGLAAALVEIAEDGGLHIRLEEESIPIREDVRGACEILGLEPIYVANEGRFVAFVPHAEEAKALDLMRSSNSAVEPHVIGQVISGDPGTVTMKNAYGVERMIDMLSGDQLPRIC